MNGGIACIIGGILGFIGSIIHVYIKRTKIEVGNPLYDEDEVIRGVFSFFEIFACTLGGLELFGFAYWIFETYFERQ